MNQEKHITEKLGRRIRKFRQAKNLSQMELAAEAGVDKGYIGSIELGKANASVKLVARIADALNVKVEQFFVERLTKE